jgi:8-oxo-dGTP pyrophosphatase MutT (NUDIX family)
MPSLPIKKYGGYQSASIVLINKENKVIIVRLNNGEWSVPGGNIDFDYAGHEDPDPTCYYGALREFKEETGFELDHRFVTHTFIYHYGRKHKHSVIYVIRSDQIFGKYDKSKVVGQETDILEYIPIEQLKDEVARKSNRFRDCVSKSLNCLFAHYDGFF